MVALKFNLIQEEWKIKRISLAQGEVQSRQKVLG